MSISIRLARSTDRAAMESISARTWDGDDYLPDVLEKWLIDPDSHFYVAVEQAANQQELLLGLTRLTRLDQDEWWMEALRVEPDRYQQGIGRLLHRHSVEQAALVGSGTLRFFTSSLNKPIHKLAAETGFSLLASYSNYRASALPVTRHEFRLLNPGDLPAVYAFLNSSPYYTQAAHSLFDSWRSYRLTEDRLRERIETSLIYGWYTAESSALEGVIVLNILPEERGRGSILDVAYLDARTGQLAPMAQAVRELAGELGFRKVQLHFPAFPERLVAMEQAGWRAVRCSDPVFLFGRTIERTARPQA